LSFTANNAYNPLGQVTEVTGTTGTGRQAKKTSTGYSYDSLGRQTSITAGKELSMNYEYSPFDMSLVPGSNITLLTV